MRLFEKNKMCIVVLCVVLLGGGLFYFDVFLPRHAPEVIYVYHQSRFFEYAPFIEKSISEIQPKEKIDLDKVLGGIVPHHIPATVPLLAEFYSSLKNTRPVKTFIILGPDHLDSGQGDISVSKASFITPFGQLQPNLEIIGQFEKSGFVVVDESPFDREFSVDSQLLFISKIFPEAKIVPLIFRSSITNETARAFGKVLANFLNEDTFIVASVDFSHYLPQKQARPIDQLSADVLVTINSRSGGLIEADSTQALTTLISAMEAKGANYHSNLKILNTADFSNNKDFTTGYVSGFWGIKSNEPLNRGSSNPEISLIFVGDIMLSRAIGRVMEKEKDWRYPFLETADLLKNADITFGNLEGPISARGTKVGSIYSFRADTRAIEGLLHAGFDVLSIANNHIWDYGADAIRDTLATVKNAGMAVIGGGVDYQEAHKPLVKDAKGVKVAFLGYTDLISSSLGSKTAKPAIAFLDIKQAVADIKEAHQLADLVVVSLHWGNEYETTHNRNQEKVAKALIDAGAQLIIGHHPHVVQGVEEYGGGYIAYSLGNFVFDQNFSPETKNGLVLKVMLKNKNISQIMPMEIGFTYSFQPYFLDSN